MSSLYYRFEQSARDTFVEFMRRAFRYGGPWMNRDLEIISVSGSVNDLVYETFFEEPEHYPVVTVSTGAGQHVSMGFNDQVENLYDVQYPMGTRSLALVDFSNAAPVAFRLPSTFTGSVGGVDVDLMWKSGYDVDDIDLAIYAGSSLTGSVVLLSSGSIQNLDVLTPTTFFGGLYPHVDINAGTSYWLVMTPQSGSVYRISVDTSPSWGYISPSPSGSIVSGSLYGDIRYAPVMRMGGAHEFTVSIRCSAKNSMEKAQNLADLTEVYVKLAQYALLNRTLDTVTKMDLSRFYINGVPYLTSKGFTVKSVSKGAMENRKRGDNDIVFTAGVNVEVRAEWSMDFDEQHILDIDLVGGVDSY
jgi:hypothetical protein